MGDNKSSAKRAYRGALIAALATLARLSDDENDYGGIVVRGRCELDDMSARIAAAEARASKLETDLREELLRTKMELADRTRAAESVSALTGEIEKLREELAGAQVSRDLAKAALVKCDKERDLLRSALEHIELEGWLGNDECGCVCCEAPAFPRTKHDRRCAVGVALNRPECTGGSES